MDLEKSKLRENTVHGDAMFPLNVYMNQQIADGRDLHCHWHEEVEFIYIEAGEAIFNIDMETIKAKKGECILINSESIHSGYSIDKKKCYYQAVVFNLNFLSGELYDVCQSKFIDPLLKKSYKFPMLLTNSSSNNMKIIDQIKEVIDLYNKKDYGSEILIKAALLKIIGLIANNGELKGEIKSPKNYKIELIKKILSYIQLNYSEKIYIENLAEEINMNTYYFCRFFKAITGKTPVEYINHFRIEQAVRILKNEDRKVSDVALDVGFENLSYFIKKFKEYKGYTPAKFKSLDR